MDAMLDEDVRKAIRSAQEGDRGAWEALHRQYSKLVFHIIVKFGVRDVDEADDLAQDIWIRAYLGLPRLQNGEVFKGWLSRIAANVLVDWVRRRARLVDKATESSFEPDTPEVAEAPSNDPDIAKAYESKDLMKLALKTLLPEQRMLIHLKHVDGCTLEEVRETMALPSVQAVFGRLARAEKRLRRAIEELSSEVALRGN